MTEQNKNNSIHNSMAVGETRQDKTRQNKKRWGWVWGIVIIELRMKVMTE